MKPVWTLLLFVSLILPAAAQPERAGSWTAYPLIVTRSAHNRVRMQLSPQGLHADHLMIYPSTQARDNGQAWRIELKDNKGMLQTRGKGGYYWIQAREEAQGMIRMASSVQYFSNPGPAPRSMLAVTKGELEIRPLRLPREHRHYRANEQWPFQVLYKGLPLAGANVELQTQQGSTEPLQTDSQGYIQVRFPDDFPLDDDSSHHGHRRQRAGFVLTASLKQGDKQILSSFNYHYTPRAYANKSLWLGTVFAVLGMAVASPLLRRRNKPTKDNAT